MNIILCFAQLTGEKSEEDKENKDNLQIDTKNLTPEEKEKLDAEDKKQREILLAKRIQAEEEEYEKVRKRIEEVKRKKLEEQRIKEEMFWRVSSKIIRAILTRNYQSISNEAYKILKDS